MGGRWHLFLLRSWSSWITCGWCPRSDLVKTVGPSPIQASIGRLSWYLKAQTSQVVHDLWIHVSLQTVLFIRFQTRCHLKSGIDKWMVYQCLSPYAWTSYCLGSPMRQCAAKKHLDFRPAAEADFPVSGPAVLGRSGEEESEELWQLWLRLVLTKDQTLIKLWSNFQ